MTELALHISAFLRDYLPRDRRASRHTVESYVTSFQLLVCFAADRLGIRPCRLEIEQLTAPLILDFLNDLEHERGNSIGTRNVRLAAFKSFFRYLEHRVPSCLDLARQMHAIPSKRGDEPLVDYLDRDELQALLDAPDPTTRSGVRDRAMLHLAYAGGLRASELTGLVCRDLAQPHLDTVHVFGKGRRDRILPLWKETRSVLRQWLAIRPAGRDQNLFLNARANAMSRHGLRAPIGTPCRHRAAKGAVDDHETHLTHTLRHSRAMHTLEATGDIRKVSLGLGHQSIQSTEIYLRADPVEKLDILASGLPPGIRNGAFRDAPTG